MWEHRRYLKGPDETEPRNLGRFGSGDVSAPECTTAATAGTRSAKLASVSATALTASNMMTIRRTRCINYPAL